MSEEARGGHEARTNSFQRFAQNYGHMDDAAVAVVFVRTAEPYRVHEALLARQSETQRPYGVWSSATGWTRHDTVNPTEDPQVDAATKEPMAALNAIPDFPDNGVYAMIWPHFAFKMAPQAVIPLIGQYVMTLCESMRRLVLIVPEAFDVPEELQTLVGVLHIDRPTATELADTVRTVVLADFSDARRPDISDEDMHRLTALGAGMTLMEFESAAAMAFAKYQRQLPNVDMEDIFSSVHDSKVDVVRRTDVLEVMASHDMTEVGGLTIYKEWLQERRYAMRPDARDYGVDTPKGCAVLGPPGTGKSAAGKATAGVLGVPLIRFDVSKLFSGLVGSSEGRTRMALNIIKAMAPCVAFLDEVDKAFDTRSAGGDSGVGSRVMGTILTFMQDCDAPVFWMLAGNRAAGLPPEMLRRGRLDEVWAVLAPEEDARLDILSIHLRKRGIDPNRVDGLAQCATDAHGYVGAELEHAVKEAVLASYIAGTRGETSQPVTGELITKMLKTAKPLSVAYKEDFDAMSEWAENNARRAEAPAAPPVRERKRASSSKSGKAGTRARKVRVEVNPDG